MAEQSLQPRNCNVLNRNINPHTKKPQLGLVNIYQVLETAHIKTLLKQRLITIMFSIAQFLKMSL